MFHVVALCSTFSRLSPRCLASRALGHLIYSRAKLGILTDQMGPSQTKSKLVHDQKRQQSYQGFANGVDEVVTVTHNQF